MTPLRQPMLAALPLSGQGERTQQAYVRAVRLLAQFYGQAPALISEQDLQPSVLHRKNVDGLAPASMRLCYSGLRFFSQHVLKRDWHTLALMRAQTAHRLPAVLSVAEVRRLLTSATPLHNQVYFTTVYSLGLRRHEALSLQVSDIDGQRLQVHVHRGQGAKDRYVPLPEETLALLRTYWKTHMKVRHFGFMNSSCATHIDALRLMIAQQHPLDCTTPQGVPPSLCVALGPTGGGQLRVVMRLWTSNRAFVDTS